MAPGTNLVVVRGCRFATGNVVRVVASGASQLSGALEKTLRLAEPIACAGNQEILVLSAGAIEGHLEVAQRLPGHIRERSAIEADDRMRQFLIGGLQMALQTYLHLTIRSEAGRIHNCIPHQLRSCSL